MSGRNSLPAPGMVDYANLSLKTGSKASLNTESFTLYPVLKQLGRAMAR